MAEEIKDLIARIQREGVVAGEKQAAQISAEAEQKAQEIIGKAKSRAAEIIEQAEAEAHKLDQSTRASLEQAGRDLLISLRREINAMLDRLIKHSLRQALKTEELALIIAGLIKAAPLSLGSQVIVLLSRQDKEKLEKEFFKQLAEETKKQIVLKSAQELESGFIISFDAGKSSFDFSSQALTEYISGSLRPELNKILKSE